MSRRTTLQGASAALQGRPAPDIDWVEVLTLANHALITPGMFRALEQGGALDGVPEEIVAFMASVAELNDERNSRLLGTFTEAVAALNGAGIEPTLLKGMALWASRPARASFARMMTDIDLLVRPDEVERAVAALEHAGFGVLARYGDPSMHVAAELGRPSDVGAVDLHRRAPGPPYMARAFEEQPVIPATEWHGRVRVPSPAQQIYLMCVHDQFHDGGYWRGGFDLRHLQDIAELTQQAEVDWAALEQLMPTRLVRNVVHAELIAAQALAGARLPDSIAGRMVPRLQFRRHYAQQVHPRWSLPLAAFGLMLEWRNIAEHRAANRAGWQALLPGSNGGRDSRWGYRPARIKGLMKMRPGKI